MALGWRKEYLRYREFFLNITALYKRNQDLRMFLEVLLSLVTISFFTFFALKPTLITIVELYKNIQTKQDLVNKMDTKIQNISAAQAIFDSEAARISLTETSIPDLASPEAFVRQIEGLAITSSVNLLGVSIGQVTLVGEEKKSSTSQTDIAPLPEGARALTFSVSVNGSYPALARFLSELENLRRPIKVDNTGLTSAQTEEGSELVLLISGRAPYLGQGN
jgi:Tfp pilus assembly protein PilO